MYFTFTQGEIIAVPFAGMHGDSPGAYPGKPSPTNNNYFVDIVFERQDGYTHPAFTCGNLVSPQQSLFTNSEGAAVIQQSIKAPMAIGVMVTPAKSGSISAIRWFKVGHHERFRVPASLKAPTGYRQLTVAPD